MTKRLTSLLIGLVLLAGCGGSEPPPRTVTEFLDNPILLEAAMVRCNQDRTSKKYDQECINARTAVRRIQAKEEEDRRIELEARSEAKRRALRRTQEAQAEARRRAAEAQRLREEAEYLAQFGVLPPANGGQEDNLGEGNLPIAVIPGAPSDAGNALPASDGGNAPIVRTEPAPKPTVQPVQQAPVQSPPAEPTPEAEEPAEENGATDLNAVREELRRRADDN